MTIKCQLGRYPCAESHTNCVDRLTQSCYRLSEIRRDSVLARSRAFTFPPQYLVQTLCASNKLIVAVRPLSVSEGILWR
jgi:hypothetical protein